MPDSPASPGRPARRSALTETLAFKTIALMVVAALGILLWAGAVPQLVGTLTSYGAVTKTVGTVTSCPDRGALREQCQVSFQTPDGPVTRQLVQTGLVGLSTGDSVPLWIDSSGAPRVGGWRPYFDSVVLLGLAVAVTTFASQLWRRVLSHGGTGPR